MRTVVPTDQVYHLWANQSQPRARNGRDSASFDGETAYSYGTPIGRVVERNGRRAYLVSTSSYSKTTNGKHLPALRSAVRGRLEDVFHVPEVAAGGWNRGGFTPSMEVLKYRERIEALQGKSKRARTNTALYAGQALEMMEEAQRFCQFFNLPTDALLATQEELAASIAALRQADHDALTRAEAQRAEREAAELAEAIPEWRAHEAHNTLLYRAPVLLRLSLDGENVETSRGARVPVRAAEYLYRRWIAGVRLDGVHVGAFEVNETEPDGLTIGCHFIPRDEADRFAESMGWTKAPALQLA